MSQYAYYPVSGAAAAGAYYVSTSGSDSNPGTPQNPFLTIQQALNSVGNSASAADVKKPYTVFIAPGVYDEDLTIPGGRIITLAAQGTVILGNGLGAAWASTNSRSISITIDSTYLFGSDIKPALNIVVVTNTDATGSLLGEAGMFRISGNLTVTQSGVTGTLNLNSVRIDGNLANPGTGLLNFQAYKSRVVGTVTTGNNLVLERAHDCEFNSLVSIAAFNMVSNCSFEAGMTVQGIQNNMPPNGMFFSNFSGTFTGPASSLRLDPVSDYFFVLNGASLAGGATKVLLSSGFGVGYAPTTAANWSVTPATVGAALDTIASSALPTAEFSSGSSGATPTINWSSGLNQKMTLTAAATVTMTNPIAGETYLLKLVQDGTGSRLVTWPGTVKWAGGAAPTLSTAAAAIDIITLYFDGTNYFGSSGIGYA